MDYEQRYKEALERAQKMLASKRRVIVEKQALETIFPELKESEDERIRKELLEYLDERRVIEKLSDTKVKEEWLAWLEKQGETFTKKDVDDAWLQGMCDAKQELEKQDEQNKSAKKTPASCALSFINYLDSHRYIGKMCVSNGECEDITDAFHNAEWNKLHRYYCKYIETPDVSDYNPYEATVKSIIAMTERYANGNDLRDFYDNVKVKCKEAVDYDKTWLEKTSRQESTDELKQKFKVGDWIFSPAWGTAHIIGTGITGVNDSDFLLEYIDGKKEYTPSEYVNSAFDKWNIEDAKDGDVLATEQFILIFRPNKYKDPIDDPRFYCRYDMESDSFKKVDEFATLAIGTKYIPATNEQRDLLFKKMKEAGYMWDDYTKSIFCMRNSND